MFFPLRISLLLLGAGWIYTTTLIVLKPLLYQSPTTTLAFPTRELDGTRVTILLIYHIIGSVLRRISTKLGYGAELSISQDEGGGYRLDENEGITLSMPFRMTNSDIQQYIKCLSHPPSPTYNEAEVLSNRYHLQLLLSALTEPSMLLLLSKINCPIDPIGSVNVRNRFEIPNIDLCKEVLDDHISRTGGIQDGSSLMTRARLDRGVKKVKRGWEFTIIVELLFNNGEVIYKQEFTMLQFHKHRTLPSPLASSDNHSKGAEEQVIGDFSIRDGEPMNWAKLSKDYNPIHTSNLAAKLLGFRKKIAHGNHVVSKAIQEASTYLQYMDQDEKKSTWMEVEFKRPITVPCRLGIRSSRPGKGEAAQRLEILVGDKIATIITCGS